MTLAEYLRTKATIVELAHRAGVSRPTVMRARDGGSCQARIYQRLSEATDGLVQPHEMLCGASSASSSGAAAATKRVARRAVAGSGTSADRRRPHSRAAHAKKKSA